MIFDKHSGLYAMMAAAKLDLFGERAREEERQKREDNDTVFLRGKIAVISHDIDNLRIDVDRYQAKLDAATRKQNDKAKRKYEIRLTESKSTLSGAEKLLGDFRRKLEKAEAPKEEETCPT